MFTSRPVAFIMAANSSRSAAWRVTRVGWSNTKDVVIGRGVQVEGAISFTHRLSAKKL
jgi:hypothetical protein